MIAGQHTRGPWTIIQPEPYDGDEEQFIGAYIYPGGIEDADGDAVCLFGDNAGSGTMFENVPNRHLIAAAPDMLAALQVARRYAYPQPATAEPVSAPDLVAMIDAAIAKATPVLSLSDSEVLS